MPIATSNAHRCMWIIYHDPTLECLSRLPFLLSHSFLCEGCCLNHIEIQKKFIPYVSLSQYSFESLRLPNVYKPPTREPTTFILKFLKQTAKRPVRPVISFFIALLPVTLLKSFQT